MRFCAPVKKLLDCLSGKIDQSGSLLNLPSTSPTPALHSFQKILTSYVAEPRGQPHWLQLRSNIGAGASVLPFFPQFHAFSWIFGPLLSNLEIVKAIVLCNKPNKKGSVNTFTDLELGLWLCVEN